MAKIIPLYSGSSGNSTFVGTNACGILIDVGKSARMTCKALEAAGIDPSVIRGIFVTHEHSDHISGIDVLARKFHIPVYGTEGTVDALARKGTVAPSVELCALDNSVDLGDMSVDFFRTQHDSAQCCGYTVTMSNGSKAGIATDLGIVTPAVLELLASCNAVMLESNYDEDMLRCSMYPYVLKERIRSASGHLSNDACAAVLPRMVQQGVTQLVLAHLSQQNNEPSLAKDTSVRTLAAFDIKENVDYQIRTAHRHDITSPVVF